MSKVSDAAQNLSADPEMALVEFVDRASAIYTSLPGPFHHDDAVFIIRFIERFVQTYSIEVDVSASKKPLNDRAVELMGRVREHRAQLVQKKIDAEIDEVISKHASMQLDAFGIAHLNAQEKKKILDGIEKIRQIIEESDIPDRKKNALFERLSSLIREVNTRGTRTDRFFAFAGDVAFLLGDMTTKAKPLLNEVKEVLKIVSRARARQEGVSLPPGDEPLQLPGPADDT